MALERKLRNLRGYGLAQDPNVELDTSFVDDQNRRMYQQKGIEAQQEAQQKNFAQRDKEGVITLLSNQEQVKTNWQPELKKKLLDTQLSIINTAFDIPQTELLSRLAQSGNQVAQYNKIGETIASNALLVAKEGFASGKNFDAIINGKSSDIFSGKSTTEALALGYAAANEVGSLPTEQEIQAAVKNVQDFAIKNTEGNMQYLGTLANGESAYKTGHPVAPALNLAGALGLANNHQRGIELMKQKGVDAFSLINSHFQQDMAYESGVQISRPKTKTGGISQENLDIGREVKENVNLFQDSFKGDGSVDISAINQYLAPYNLDVAITDADKGLIKFTRKSTSQRGESVQKDVTAEININDSEAIYNLIAKNNPHIKREYIDNTTYTDPTKGEKVDNTELKADVDALLNGVGTVKERKILSKFDDISVKEYSYSSGELKKPKVLTIDGEDFNMTKPERAKEAYLKIEEKGYKEGAKGYKIGQEDGGYKYLGGDPSKQENWEEIK